MGNSAQVQKEQWVTEPMYITQDHRFTPAAAPRGLPIKERRGAEGNSAQARGPTMRVIRKEHGDRAEYSSSGLRLTVLSLCAGLLNPYSLFWWLVSYCVYSVVRRPLLFLVGEEMGRGERKKEWSWRVRGTVLLVVLLFRRSCDFLLEAHRRDCYAPEVTAATARAVQRAPKICRKIGSRRYAQCRKRKRLLEVQRSKRVPVVQSAGEDVFSCPACPEEDVRVSNQRPVCGEDHGRLNPITEAGCPNELSECGGNCFADDDTDWSGCVGCLENLASTLKLEGQCGSNLQVPKRICRPIIGVQTWLANKCWPASTAARTTGGAG